MTLCREQVEELDLNRGPCDSESVLPRFALSSRSGFMQKGLRLQASDGHKGRLPELGHKNRAKCTKKDHNSWKR